MAVEYMHVDKTQPGIKYTFSSQITLLFGHVRGKVMCLGFYLREKSNKNG